MFGLPNWLLVKGSAVLFVEGNAHADAATRITSLFVITMYRVWAASMPIIIFVQPAGCAIQYVHGSGGSCFHMGLVSFSMDLYDALTHILEGCFTGTNALIWMFQCQWSNPERYGLIQSVPNHYKAQIVQHDSYASFLYKHSKIYSAYKYYMTYCNVSMCLYI